MHVGTERQNLNGRIAVLTGGEKGFGKFHMSDEIKERFGRLDVLVSNAADGWIRPVAELTEQRLPQRGGIGDNRFREPQ